MINKISLAASVFYRRLFGRLTFLVTDERFVKDTYFLRYHHKLAIESPKSFNEHICAIKVLKDESDLTKYTDKYLVRDYVTKTIGSSYVNELLGAYDSFEQIDFSILPDQFVIKTNHGSGYNIIVKDKSIFDVKMAERKIKKWMSTNYYYVGRERNYKMIRPKIMIEKYLKSSLDELDEVKVYCFMGVPRLISYNHMSNGTRYCDFFTALWEPIPVRRTFPNFGIEPPIEGNDILKLASQLAQPFDFVRVDLYKVDSQIFFSELTFHDGSGLLPFDPKEYDIEFGKFFDGVEL